MLHVALQTLPVQLGVPFVTAGHGVHELPQVATLLLLTQAPEQT